MVAPGNVRANEMSAIDAGQRAGPQGCVTMRLERHIVREPARCAGTRNGTSDLMRAYARLNIAAACLTIGAVSAQAQSVPGDVERGRELAERVCSNCHKVKADPAAPVSTDVLSFPSIANRPGVSAGLLAGRIIVPHPAMPNVQLTVRELREVIAYILSLKRGN